MKFQPPRQPQTRESAAEKARRYLTEGRLTIHEVTWDTIRATCRGSGAVWHPMWRHDGWSASALRA